MGLLRSLGLAGLGTVFLLGLLMSNLLVGVDRTVMDEEFVTDTLEDEEVYGAVVDQVGQQLSNKSEIPVDPEAIVTDEYVQRQVEANIGVVYAYLHGERDDIILRINTTALKDRLADEIEGQIRDQAVSRFDEDLGRMLESQDQYLQVRAEFKQEQLQTIQQSTDENLTQQELEAAYQDRQDTIRQQLLDQLPSGSNLSILQEATRDVLILRADALLGNMTHSTFVSEFNTIMDRTAPRLADQTTDQIIGNVPQTIDVTERLEPSQQERLEQAQEAVSIFSMLVIAVPVVTVGLAAVIWVVASTTPASFLTIGGFTALAGLLSTVLGWTGRNVVLPELERTVLQDAPSIAADTGSGFLQAIIDTVMTQSIVLLAVGILIVLAGVVLGRGQEDDAPEAGSSSEGSET